MPYGSIDFPAHDKSRTVGSKCHVWHSKLRQSLRYASTSDLFSLALIVLLFNVACSFSVESFFDWLLAPSAVLDTGDEPADVESDFFVSLVGVDELAAWDGFGEDARTNCELNWKKDYGNVFKALRKEVSKCLPFSLFPWRTMWSSRGGRRMHLHQRSQKCDPQTRW